MTDPRQSGESYAELENKVGLDLLDTMIYHQETIERYLAGLTLHGNPIVDKGFTDGDEVLGELLEIVKQFTEGIDPDA
jgi:hypothetical protein